MHASTEDKKPFNLSRWAIGHPSIARFILALIIIRIEKRMKAPAGTGAAA